jgi:hypothetical protein
VLGVEWDAPCHCYEAACGSGCFPPPRRESSQRQRQGRHTTSGLCGSLCASRVLISGGIPPSPGREGSGLLQVELARGLVVAVLPPPLVSPVAQSEGRPCVPCRAPPSTGGNKDQALADRPLRRTGLLPFLAYPGVLSERVFPGSAGGETSERVDTQKMRGRSGRRRRHSFPGP